MDPRWEVADNPDTPPDVLVALSKVEDDSILCRVGGNPSTPPDVLAYLAERKHGPQIYVARNLSASPDTLTRLSQDKAYWVRWYAAKNPSTPYGIWIPVRRGIGSPLEGVLHVRLF